jgi:transposase-like protein
MSEKPNRQRRRHTLEFKQAAVRMVTEEGLSQAEVSRAWEFLRIRCGIGSGA